MPQIRSRFDSGFTPGPGNGSGTETETFPKSETEPNRNKSVRFHNTRYIRKPKEKIHKILPHLLDRLSAQLPPKK